MSWDGGKKMFLICLSCNHPCSLCFYHFLLLSTVNHGNIFICLSAGKFFMSLIFPMTIFCSPSKAATSLWESVAGFIDRTLAKPWTPLFSYILISNYPILVLQNIVNFFFPNLQWCPDTLAELIFLIATLWCQSSLHFLLGIYYCAIEQQFVLINVLLLTHQISLHVSNSCLCLIWS